ncbi:MAG: T9SS type A sorting domain-containing protein [Ignavibacteria bacterium]|nr:T9SS type A sorting domain-containing protein [Ignavibacteria bacterium]
MKYSFFIILQMIFILNSFAQVQQEWVRTFNNTNNSDDYPVNIGFDSLGNVLVLGTSNAQNLPKKLILIKYSKTGDLIWSRNFSTNVSSSEYPGSLVIDRNSNIYVCSSNSNKIVIIKFDSTGNVIWVNKFSRGNYAYYTSIDLDVNMNVYVAGDFEGGIVILKYDIDGRLLWQKQILDVSITSFQLLKLDKSSNVIITYYKYLSFDDIVVVKFTSQGDSLWARIYNSGNYDHPYDIDFDSNNNIYVLGESDGSPFSYNNYLFVLIKYDSSGNQKWIRKYDGNGLGRNYPVKVRTDKLGNIFVTGSAFYSNLGYDFTLIKYNSFGDSIWVSRFNDQGNDNDFVSSIIVDNYNDIYSLGYSKNSDSSYRLTTLKYNQNGMLVWSQHQNSFHYSSIIPDASIIIDSNYSIYVLGGLRSLNTDIDLMTIKYSQLIGINPISTEVPSKYTLHQNYPNPFNPSTKIKFEIPAGVVDIARICVYDILGKEVRSIINENLKPGIYEAEFNAADLPSGVYFYKLSAGGFIDTKKMILVK